MILAPRALQSGVLCALTAAALATAPVALGDPTPDPAPAPPVLAPDPAPEAVAPRQPAEPPPAAPAPAPTQAAPAPVTPPLAAPTTITADPPAVQPRSRRSGRPQKESREAEPAIPPPVSFFRLDALVPPASGSQESSSAAILLAAGALLMLVLASGSFVSVLARLMPPAAVLVVALVAAAPASAGTISPNCDTASGRDGCSRWYTAPKVSLSWSVDPGGGDHVSGCQVTSFTLETAPRYRDCKWSWSGSVFTATVWIGIDRTAPQVTSLRPDRPPDHNGWFNHPVGLSFQGTDALSGVESCSATTYSGPGGAGAAVSGSCTDVAGNSGTGSLTLNYDAIPPSAPRVEAAPGDRRVSLSWSGSGEAEVARFHGGESVIVYRGAGHAHNDAGLRNEERYRYVVTLRDQAGNRASSEASVVPTASPLITPSARAKLSAPPLLRWRKVRRASYYNVQVVRGRRKILSRWPRTNELQLKRRWRFAGRPRRLVAGRYCWYVWPGYGARAKRDYGKVLGRRCFTMTR